MKVVLASESDCNIQCYIAWKMTTVSIRQGQAQTKGLPSLTYHELALAVRFVRGSAGTTSLFTIRGHQGNRHRPGRRHNLHTMLFR